MSDALKIMKEGPAGCSGICRRFFFAVIWVLISASAVQPADVTTHVEFLGIPFSGRYSSGQDIYARNVWDLQAFKGRIYVGGGNWDNKGPAPNAGPVPILAWDSKTETIVCEGQVDDEEISRFEVIAGKLYIPGADARQSWDFGNLYCREPDGRWQKRRTIPRAIHVFALTGYKGLLYAGLKATDTVPWYVDFKGYGAAVAVSENGGRSWDFLPIGGFAVFDFLRVDGCLYAMDLTTGPGLKKWVSKQGRKNYYAPVYALDTLKGRFVRRPDLDAAHLFPNTHEAPERACGVHRPVLFGQSALYIGVSGNGPFGLYRAKSLREGEIRTARIPLPQGTIPRDLLVRKNAVFVLLQGPAADKNGVQIRVLASGDLDNWIDLLQLTAPTFARSFELLNGDFYFGLGCKVKFRSEWQQDKLHPETGSLLRVEGRWLPLLKSFLK